MSQPPALNGKPVSAVRIRQVIEVQAVRGKGTNADPCRVILQYWSLDGELLAENDVLMTGEDPEPPHLPQ